MTPKIIFTDNDGNEIQGKPLFADRKQYEEFCEEYRKKITPELERLLEARIRSEEESMHRWVHDHKTSTGNITTLRARKTLGK